MKINQITEDSKATEQAKKLGLHHIGWGKYAKDGKVVAQSKGDKLVMVGTDKPYKGSASGLKKPNIFNMTSTAKSGENKTQVINKAKEAATHVLNNWKQFGGEHPPQAGGKIPSKAWRYAKQQNVHNDDFIKAFDSFVGGHRDLDWEDPEEDETDYEERNRRINRIKQAKNPIQNSDNIDDVGSDMTKLTPKQEEKTIDWFSKKSLKELRKRQETAYAQTKIAYGKKNDSALQNLQKMSELLAAAIDKKEFGDEDSKLNKWTDTKEMRDAWSAGGYKSTPEDVAQFASDNRAKFFNDEADVIQVPPIIQQMLDSDPIQGGARYDVVQRRFMKRLNTLMVGLNQYYTDEE